MTKNLRSILASEGLASEGLTAAVRPSANARFASKGSKSASWKMETYETTNSFGDWLVISVGGTELFIHPEELELFKRSVAKLKASDFE